VIKKDSTGTLTSKEISIEIPVFFLKLKYISKFKRPIEQCTQIRPITLNVQTVGLVKIKYHSRCHIKLQAITPGCQQVAFGPQQNVEEKLNH
jgi:hypothetical protein